MIFDLTDEDREALEAMRGKLGLRSRAAVLRALIQGGCGHLSGAVASSAQTMAVQLLTPQPVAYVDWNRMVLELPESVGVRTDATEITVGPIVPKPGSRLKKGK